MRVAASYAVWGAVLNKHQLMLRLFGLYLIVFIGSCASDNTPAPPRILVAQFDSAEVMNPREDGSSQGVDVLLLQLETPHKLAALDLTALYPQLDKPSQALGSDLVLAQRLRVEPGVDQRVVLEIDVRTRYVGLVVAFEQYQVAKWKDSIQLRDDSALDKVLFRNKKLKVSVGDLSVALALEN